MADRNDLIEYVGKFRLIRRVARGGMSRYLEGAHGDRRSRSLFGRETVSGARSVARASRRVVMSLAQEAQSESGTQKAAPQDTSESEPKKRAGGRGTGMHVRIGEKLDCPSS